MSWHHPNVLRLGITFEKESNEEEDRFIRVGKAGGELVAIFSAWPDHSTFSLTEGSLLHRLENLRKNKAPADQTIKALEELRRYK